VILSSQNTINEESPSETIPTRSIQFKKQSKITHLTDQKNPVTNQNLFSNYIKANSPYNTNPSPPLNHESCSLTSANLLPLTPSLTRPPSSPPAEDPQSQQMPEIALNMNTDPI
jgi:hypothetical protein